MKAWGVGAWGVRVLAGSLTLPRPTSAAGHGARPVALPLVILSEAKDPYP